MINEISRWELVKNDDHDKAHSEMTHTLTRLHESFIERANRPMTFDAFPVSPKKAESPVIVMDRWQVVDDVMIKTYRFRREGDRGRFLLDIFDHEHEVQHFATIIIKSNDVTLRLSTTNIDTITELDKEYARFADVLFKDIVYSSEHEHHTR